MVMMIQPAFSAQVWNSPRSASPSMKNRTPITAHLPPAPHAHVVSAPMPTLNGSVWVSVRCPLWRCGSCFILVRSYVASDAFSMTSARNSETRPNVLATVAPPLPAVTRPDMSRSGSSAPPAQTAVPTAICSGDW
jgi:hypothetical protein